MAHLTGQARAEYVQTMFDRIAERYDLMNRLMTFGQDVSWRRYVIQQAELPQSGRLLDIATGTGEIAYEAIRQTPNIQAVGGDFAIEMMRAGQRIPERHNVQWSGADALHLPFDDETFDAVTSGFLMRNIIDVEKGFAEQNRVLKGGGRVVVLESSPPKENLLKPFILIHLNQFIPAIGRLVTGDSTAYRYLPDSTQAFRTPAEVASAMQRAGFIDVRYRLFMFGTIAIHTGRKPYF